MYFFYCLKIVINFPGPIRSYTVKENHVTTAVNEILWYRQTHTHRDPVTFISNNYHLYLITLCSPLFDLDIIYKRTILKGVSKIINYVVEFITVIYAMIKSKKFYCLIDFSFLGKVLIGHWFVIGNLLTSAFN